MDGGGDELPPTGRKSKFAKHRSTSCLDKRQQGKTAPLENETRLNVYFFKEKREKKALKNLAKHAHD